jgi:hypothetical protein
MGVIRKENGQMPHGKRQQKCGFLIFSSDVGEAEFDEKVP